MLAGGWLSPWPDKDRRRLFTAGALAATIVEAYGLETEGGQSMKAGYKSTEFWLTVIANVVGATLASGLVIEGSPLAQVLGIATIVLSNLGYSMGRAHVKREAEHWRNRGRSSGE